MNGAEAAARPGSALAGLGTARRAAGFSGRSSAWLLEPRALVSAGLDYRRWSDTVTVTVNPGDHTVNLNLARRAYRNLNFDSSSELEHPRRAVIGPGRPGEARLLTSSST